MEPKWTFAARKTSRNLPRTSSARSPFERLRAEPLVAPTLDLNARCGARPDLRTITFVPGLSMHEILYLQALAPLVLDTYICNNILSAYQMTRATCRFFNRSRSGDAVTAPLTHSLQSASFLRSSSRHAKLI